MHPQPEEFVCLGAIAAAHGIKGEVKLKPFTDQPLGIGAYGPLFDETGCRRFEVLKLRLAGNAVIARFSGIDDRTSAESLIGIRLYAPRAALPEPDHEEYYQADLIGLEVLDQTGNSIGEVSAVHNFGAGDILEIRPEGSGEPVLVPFTKGCVPTVDIKARRIEVDL